MIFLVVKLLQGATRFYHNYESTIWSILSIIISGLLSLWISRYYYRKGNRNAVEQNVFLPVIQILSKPISKQCYKELSSIPKLYDFRFLTQSEVSAFRQLEQAYKKVSHETIEEIEAEALKHYFIQVLREAGIIVEQEPVIIQSEVIAYQIPERINYLKNDIARQLDSIPYDWHENAHETQGCIDILLKRYAKDVFGDKKISFFEKCDIENAISQTEAWRKYEEKYQEYLKAKKSFLSQSSLTELQSIE